MKREKVSGNRVRRDEVNAAIFRPLDNENQPEVEDTFEEYEEEDVVVYTIIGKEDFKDDKGHPILTSAQGKRRGRVREVEAEERPEAYAKREFSNNKWFYYVKVDARGRIYNPIGMYSETVHRKSDSKRPSYEFREVSEETFYFYVRFLTTKNATWIVRAEREIV